MCSLSPPPTRPKREEEVGRGGWWGQTLAQCARRCVCVPFGTVWRHSDPTAVLAPGLPTVLWWPIHKQTSRLANCAVLSTTLPPPPGGNPCPPPSTGWVVTGAEGGWIGGLR